MNHLSSLLLNNIHSIELPMSLQCQLRCKYCYIHDDIYKTQPVNYDAIIRMMDASVEFFPAFLEGDSAIIPWGAEPLCNWNVIEKALRYAFKTYPCFVKTAWSTNGILMPQRYIDFINEFTDRIIYLQISFDGPPEVHNYSRIYPDGRGSYDKVRKTVDIIKEKCPNLKNKLTFKATLSSEQLELHHFYKAIRFFLTEMKFPSDPVTLVNDKPYTPQAVKALKEDLARLKNEWEDIKTINKDAQINLFNRLEYQHDPHCSACKNQVEVDFNGDFYPCHGPITALELRPYFRLGNVFNKTVDDKAIYRSLYGKYNASLIRSPLCQSCCVHKINPAFCHVCIMDTMNATHTAHFFPISTCKPRQAIGEAFLEWKNDGLI